MQAKPSTEGSGSTGGKRLFLSRLKPIASERVGFNDAVGTIIFDGQASMHRSTSKGPVAVEVALNDNVRALVSGMLIEIRRLKRLGGSS